MLVIDKMSLNLREYLRQNHNQLTWKERIRIIYYIINALLRIYQENSIHRDLHSGNILYSSRTNNWYISDFGFCGPADKPPKSIYGNLPYIAPEVIVGKEYTFATDIYSIAMLMWEISSGQPPFVEYEHDYYLAMNIINGIRPRVLPGTPSEYESLMKQCWDADPLKRPSTELLFDRINRINLSYQKMPHESNTTKNLKITTCTNSTDKLSKFHQFIENLPEPKNATEEEQEAFHSRPYNFQIPDNVEDFDESNSQKNNRSGNFEDVQNDYIRKETIQQIKKHHIIIDGM
ncbi:kinase-like domain-containing protein [Glomus cerebriforme]|uniref:Kinase-like domain-containing protein n=1 Tax=Glomus cerebriforme TaxID=658196 RepID=A0A397SN07_9GLOM|nr:kinase-like domain-containing protein [Glomus cerebriforme]